MADDIKRRRMKLEIKNVIYYGTQNSCYYNIIKELLITIFQLTLMKKLYLRKIETKVNKQKNYE